MGHYAYVTAQGIVEQVIVATQDVIDSGAFGNSSSWVKTSYNTRGGKHYDPATNELSADQSKALRGNYPGIGYTYDQANDVFYAPQPYPSWILNQTTWTWEAPIAMPTDGKLYNWDEATTSWIEVA